MSVNYLELVDAQGQPKAREAPAIPEGFLTRLQGYDRDLFVVWAPLRGRHLIMQCTQHLSAGKPINCGHTHLCRAVSVIICQDADGVMVPLNDRIFSTLAEMRGNSERFGGQTERGLDNFKRFSAGLDLELEAKRTATMQDNLQHNQKWHRRQFNKLWDMLDALRGAPNK